VVQNPVQVIAAPVQIIKPTPVVQNPVQAIAAPVQLIKPLQAVQNPVQEIEKPKPAVIVPTIVQQLEPEPAFDPELADIPELEDDSNPTLPDPPTLLQQPLHPPQQKQPEIPVPPELQEVIQRAALHKKIVGFGARDIERANALKLHLERQDRSVEHKARVKRLAELKEKNRLLEYRNRAASSSSDSSNYDTPPGSLATTATTKEKGKLKKIWNKSPMRFHSASVTQD